MAEPTAETGFITWFISLAGLAVSMVSALFGHIHWRINAERKDTRDEMDKVWSKLDEHQKQFQAIPTKGDIAELKADLRRDIDRLVQAFTGKPPAK